MSRKIDWPGPGLRKQVLFVRWARWATAAAAGAFFVVDPDRGALLFDRYGLPAIAAFIAVDAFAYLYLFFPGTGPRHDLPLVCQTLPRSSQIFMFPILLAAALVGAVVGGPIAMAANALSGKEGDGSSTEPRPPHFAEYLLFLFLPRREREPIAGDLNEDFLTNVLPRFGHSKAWVWYWCQTLICIGIYAFRGVINPLITQVVEPLWIKVLWPIVKWVAAPVFFLADKNRFETIWSWVEKHLR